MPADQTHPITTQLKILRSEAIARLNDAVRLGHDPRARIMITRGVADLLATTANSPNAAAQGLVNQARLMRQIAQAPIDPEDDPYGEHDFGAVTFMSVRLFWKIDAYADDGTFAHGSEAPWDAAVTKRVLTIMRADEY